jgi:predicted acetyltransferase
VINDLVFGPPLTTEDFATYLELGEYAFSEAPPATPRLARLTEDEPDEPIYRVGRRAGEIVCRARVVPMGQWFGGQVVPMGAIGGVVVAAEHRSGGVGTALAADFIRAAHGRGMAISTLFPASLPLYRKVGYELAGASYYWEIPIGATAPPRRSDDGIVVQRWSGGDFALRPLYDQEASRTSGQLDRPPTFWTGVMESHGQAVHAFVAERDDNPVGYITFTQTGKYDAERYIDVLDFVTTSRAATRALWTFLTGHSGTVSHVRTWGGATDTRLFDLPHRGQRILTVEPWMVRIIDLPGALMARGYPDRVAAELHLDYRDDILPDNSGRWLVRIADGRATVERGGDGRIVLTSRGLAPVYTGYLPAASVADPAVLSGTAEDLASMTTVFAGPTPWMADSF